MKKKLTVVVTNPPTKERADEIIDNISKELTEKYSQKILEEVNENE